MLTFVLIGLAAKCISYVLVGNNEAKLTLDLGAAVSDFCCRVVELSCGLKCVLGSGSAVRDLVLARAALFDLCVATDELVGVLHAGRGESDPRVEETSVRNRDA